jgi:hypothetical protein
LYILLSSFFTTCFGPSWPSSGVAFYAETVKLYCSGVVDFHHTKKTTPTRWWRKRRTAGTNVTKTAGRVEHNHNSATVGRYNINKTTPTRWWRKRKTAGANVTKTAGRVEHNHNRTTAGRYSINKKGTSGRRLVRGRDFKNKNKN